MNYKTIDLISQLKNNISPSLATQAARDLGDLGDPIAIPFLVEVVLGKLQYPITREDFTGASMCLDVDILRQQSVISAYMLGFEAETEKSFFLKKLLKAAIYGLDVRTRKNASLFLKSFLKDHQTKEEMFEYLLKVVDDPYVSYKERACDILGDFGDRRAIDSLNNVLLQQKYGLVYDSARLALNKLSNQLP